MWLSWTRQRRPYRYHPLCVLTPSTTRFICLASSGKCRKMRATFCKTRNLFYQKTNVILFWAKLLYISQEALVLEFYYSA